MKNIIIAHITFGNILLTVLLTLMCWLSYTIYTTPQPEYVIELVDQDTAIVRTPDTTYFCTPEQIEEIIFNDNL